MNEANAMDVTAPLTRRPAWQSDGLLRRASDWRLAMDNGEPGWYRRLWELVALGVAILFLYYTHAFWAPAHPGVDQNGYVVGGRNLASTGSMAIRTGDPENRTTDPFLFVGRMWIGTDLNRTSERFYPKYPVGLPLIYAGALKLGGPEWGQYLLYMVSPLGMTIGLLATFLLARMLTSSPVAVLAMITVAVSPPILALANNPNSHGASVGAVALGMYLLVRWMRRGGALTALAAGLCLGFSTSIRYSEGILGLPVAIAAVSSLRARKLQGWSEALLLVMGWALPVGGLVVHNLREFSALTGYDPSNESTGFDWGFFDDNWENMLRQMYSLGMVMVFPLGIAGILGMIAWQWRLGLIMATWVLPCMAIYTFYYWAPEGHPTGYLRFFVTCFPGLACGAAWLASTGGDWMVRRAAPRWGLWRVRTRLSAVLAAGGLTLLSVVLACRANQLQLGQEQRSNLLLSQLGDEVKIAVPPGSLVFCNNGNWMHHLQLVGDWKIYNAAMFESGAIASFCNGGSSPEDPQTVQPAWREAIRARIGGWDNKRLLDEQNRIMDEAFAAHRRVFFVVPPMQRPTVDRFTSGDGYQVKQVSRWQYTLAADPVEREARRPAGHRANPDARRQRAGANSSAAVILEILPPPPKPS